MKTIHEISTFLDAYKTSNPDKHTPRWGGLSFFSEKWGKITLDVGPDEFDTIISSLNKEVRADG